VHIFLTSLIKDKNIYLLIKHTWFNLCIFFWRDFPIIFFMKVLILYVWDFIVFSFFFSNVSFWLFKIKQNLIWNQQMFNISLWQNILIKLQPAIKVNQFWRLKVFWLYKLLDDCWNDMINNKRLPHKFWAHTQNWTTHHITRF
jgi:hypothetical protein